MTVKELHHFMELNPDQIQMRLAYRRDLEQQKKNKHHVFETPLRWVQYQPIIKRR